MAGSVQAPRVDTGRLRILQVVHGYPPREHAGAELCCAYLSGELLRRGHEVRVFARTDDRSLPAFSVQAEEVDGVPVVRANCPTEYAASLEEMYAQPRATALFEAELARKPDIVHIHHLYGMSTDFVERARKAGAKVVLTLHDFWYLCPRGQRLTPRNHLCEEIQPWRCSLCIAKKRVRWAANALKPRPRDQAGSPFSALGRAARYLSRNTAVQPIHRRREFILGQLNQAHLCLSPSEFVLEEHKRHGVHQPRMEWSPNGMVTEWVSKLPERDARHQPLRFGFLGSFLRSKGVDRLLEAFATLPAGSAELHLHGTSPWDDGRYAKQLADKHQAADVHFHGSYPRESLAEVLSGIDVVVVPSRWYENAPVTLDEAALARLPVITTNHGGMKEWVERRGNGLLFADGDPDALRSAMHGFVSEPELWSRLRDPKVPVRTVAQQADEVLGYYGELVQRSAL